MPSAAATAIIADLDRLAGELQAELASGRVDADDPETAEVGLALAPVEPGVPPLAVNGLYGRLPELPTASAEALRVLLDAVPTVPRLESTFGARHFRFLLLRFSSTRKDD